ncbi:MAG: hypothetical protein ALECFALPRED_010378 [Alectoria fallacina]|uniref:Uncharacterized protein n=1 Tax=Alectoria fallacina TaxID=1903189 RepID=A0A8H3F4M0_9LECA|nr:MAG: hypothetical protein ALECFALPRED_010378 [Alectoria fallacina]
MAHNTPDDTSADTPIDTPVAPDFPGQTYRDRSSSPNSDDSDSGPKKAIPRRPNNEPSQSPTEIDPSAGPIPPFYVHPANLIPNPFRPPPLGTPGVNPFKGLPVPPKPGIDRRDLRPTTAQGVSPPSRPPTRGPAAGGGSDTAQAGDPPRRTSGPSAPGRPSAKRTAEGEGSNSAQAGSSTQSIAGIIPPRHPSPPLGSLTHTTSDLHPSGPDGKSQKRRPPKKHKPKPRRPYVRVADRERIVTEPARNTRQQRERVEFGFGDLDRFERRRREERKAEREREKKSES